MAVPPELLVCDKYTYSVRGYVVATVLTRTVCGKKKCSSHKQTHNNYIKK